MVHADAAAFAANVSKKEAYAQVIEHAAALFEGQTNWVCNLANAASLLWHAYKSMPAPSNRVNWAGFYLLDPKVTNQLILGPFQGKVACQTIAFGKGVCGTAASRAETQVVANIDQYPGHIACDSDTKSEIVVPIINDGKVVAVIDIDCVLEDSFGGEDRAGLENLAALIARSCSW